MSRSKDEIIAKIAVKKGLMTLDQLEFCQNEFEALDMDVKADYSLLDIIINNGFATKIQLENLDESVENSLLMELSSSPLEHQIIDGYEIREKLGSGAMGVVYRALHKAIGRDVALKILPPKLAKDDEYKERFLREARAAAKLNHPNIVCAYDVGMSNGLYYFAMEFIEGRSVMELIKEKGLIEEAEAIEIIKQVALALKVAWKQLIVHRDVKPENIIINKDGLAKLCDLGLAKQIDADPHLTASGAAVGTPFYISPEQAKGIQDIDTRSDIYSLGATFFHMVIGRPPFEGNSAAVIMTKHINQPLPEPCVLRRTLSPKIGFVMKKMMAKLPEDRYQNPVELLEDIERYERNKPLAGQRKTKQLSNVTSPISTQPAISRSSRIKSDILTKNIRHTHKVHQPSKHHKGSKKNSTALIVTSIIVVAVVALILVLAKSVNNTDPNDKDSTEVADVNDKTSEIAKVNESKESTSEDDNEPVVDKEKQKLEALRKEIQTLLDEAELKHNQIKFMDSISILEQIVQTEKYNVFPELINIANDRLKKVKIDAENTANYEITQIEDKIANKGFATDKIAPFYNHILELWNEFNEELKFTETYKTKVIGEAGIIAELNKNADEYLEDIKKKVESSLSNKQFEIALMAVTDGQARLPESYENSLYQLINQINDAKSDYQDELSQILLEKQKNAPEMYKTWFASLRNYLKSMKINEAVENCNKNLASDDFNLNETVKTDLEKDLKLLTLIQTIYSDVYTLIHENGQSGKTLKIDFDEYEDNNLYINFTDLVIDELELETILKKDIQFELIVSDDPQKKGNKDKYQFSKIPDNVIEFLYRYTLGLSKEKIETKLAKLFTFYVLNLPDFPEPKENEISDAVIKMTKILLTAESLSKEISLHPILHDFYHTRLNLVALTRFSEIEKKYKLWDRKSKSKSKNELAEELISEIKDFLDYFENSEVLTNNDNENEKKLHEWLLALQKQLMEDREVELFYGDYKLKGNKLEITYDFEDAKQLLDFAPSDTNQNGVYGWDKTKKALMLSASPSFRRENRNIAGLKWLAMFGEKEFDIKMELEIPHGLFYSLNLCKNADKQYSIPLRARMQIWQRIHQIKHGLYSGKLDVMETENNKPLSELSDDMTPESGSVVYRVRRDRKGYISSYINNKLIFKVKDDSLIKGFMEFNSVFARIYIKRLEIKCELDKDWLKEWENNLKAEKDPRKEYASKIWNSDEDFKKEFEWDRDRGRPNGPR